VGSRQGSRQDRPSEQYADKCGDGFGHDVLCTPAAYISGVDLDAPGQLLGGIAFEHHLR
jgi:hypothetical protein